jgi:hypothetical protein
MFVDLSAGEVEPVSFSNANFGEIKGKVKKAWVMFLLDYSMTSKQENFRTRCSSKDVISFTFTDSRIQSLVPHG